MMACASPSPGQGIYLGLMAPHVTSSVNEHAALKCPHVEFLGRWKHTDASCFDSSAVSGLVSTLNENCLTLAPQVMKRGSAAAGIVHKVEIIKLSVAFDSFSLTQVE